MTWNEAQRIGRMLCVSLSGTELTHSERQMFARAQPGGIILFARNCQSPPQVRALTDEIRLVLGAGTLIGIDQEGGRVDRLRSLLTAMPAAEEVATRGGAKAAARLGKLTAHALRLLGFNFNFAPVLDVVTPARRGRQNGLDSRTFGETPQSVTACASDYLNALQDGGMSGCVKHFPGLGGAAVDPHDELPVVAASREEIEAIDLMPFRAVLTTGAARAVMVSHAVYPNLKSHTDEQQTMPASLSPTIVTKLLRGEIGFDGVVMTDDLTMGAAIKAAGDLRGAACAAVAAGHDLLLVCATSEEVEEVHAALVAQLDQGAMSEARVEQSLARLNRLSLSAGERVRFDEPSWQSISAQIADLHATLSLTELNAPIKVPTKSSTHIQ